MGIYDRDYYREQRPGVSLRAPRTAVGILVAINVVIYLANALLTGDTDQITTTLSVSDDTLRNPVLWWQFLTYGFVHARSPLHILFNMLQLWFLGRAVEDRYGRGEFLRVYLVMLVVGSVVWAVTSAAFDPRYVMPNGLPNRQLHLLLGASGAVSGVVILFVLNFPHQTLILFPIPIPIKAWVIGLLLVVGNLMGALGQMGNTAFGVHLTGIAFAFAYHRFGWRLSGLIGPWLPRIRFKRRPELRIHDPTSRQPDLSAEVDRILEKIHLSGEASLTRKERRVLEDASRRYKHRRQG